MRRVIAAAAVLIALAGCSQLPAPDPTSDEARLSSPSSSATTAPTTPAVTPTTTPSIAPAATKVPVITELVMHGDALTALAADGSTVKTIKYTARPATAVTALTRVFGSKPAHTTSGKSVYSGGAEIYRWRGFEMRIEKSGTNLEPRIGVFITRATINGVALHSIDGVRVGGSAADAFAAHPGTEADNAEAFTVDSVKVGTSGDDVLTHSVRVIGSAKTGKITTLLAPAKNFGA